MPKDYYLLVIYDDIEPELIKFDSEDDRDATARKIRETGDNDGLYPLTVDRGADVDVWAYSGGFFDEEAAQ